MAERINVTLAETLKTLLDEKKYSTLRDILITMNPADTAGVFEEIGDERITLLFRLLPKEEAAETFVEMEPEYQELLIKGFSDSELKEVLDELYVDDAVDVVEEMPANVVRRILAAADPAMRRDINSILRYPDDSAGSLMTTEYVSLRPEMTVEDAILRIRRTGVDKETIYTAYVTNDRYLLGYVTLKDLLLCPDDDKPVNELMDENIIFVNTHTDKEEVAQMFAKYNLLAMPVVDMDGRLVGIVTVDDAIDVMQEEATEDIEIMNAIRPSDKTYLKSSALDQFRKRIPWLMVLMISATFTGLIISKFEDALKVQVVLTAFIPMLMGTGGNSGSQSCVTITRALSLGEVTLSDAFRVLWKEFCTAVLCGLTLGVVCFIKMMLIDRLLFANPDVTAVVGIVVSLAVAATVIVAKCIGSLMPLLAQKIGIDPAVMSSPFISTLVDALSLLVYFGIATLILF